VTFFSEAAAGRAFASAVADTASHCKYNYSNTSILKPKGSIAEALPHLHRLWLNRQWFEQEIFDYQDYHFNNMILSQSIARLFNVAGHYLHVQFTRGRGATKPSEGKRGERRRQHVKGKRKKGVYIEDGEVEKKTDTKSCF